MQQKHNKNQRNKTVNTEKYAQLNRKSKLKTARYAALVKN
jgi:hypothetical protein